MAAIDLFQKNGVNGTSVDQILAKSATGKSQFSHYFKTKQGLIHSVLNHLHEMIEKGQTPTGYSIRSWSELNLWFKGYIEFQRSVDFERSCPVATIGTDVGDDQEILRQDLRIFLDWSRSSISRFFVERKAAGELVAGVDPDALADFLITVMQGGMLLTKLRRDTEMFENAAAQALAYIKSLRRKPASR